MDEVFKNDDESVEQAIRSLMHHFDAVQIFATRHEVSNNGPRTIGVAKGSGNYFSRKGIVQEWIEDGLGSPEDEVEEYRDDFTDTEIDDPEDED